MGVGFFGAARRHFADLEGFWQRFDHCTMLKTAKFSPAAPLESVKHPIVQSAKEIRNINCNPLRRKVSFQHQSVKLSAYKFVQSAKQSVQCETGSELPLPSPRFGP